jgi:hypothetical protein
MSRTSESKATYRTTSVRLPSLRGVNMERERKRYTFQVTFDDVELTREMQDRIAEAVRKAALFEITVLDVRNDLLPRLAGAEASCRGCGGGCHVDADFFQDLSTAKLRGESRQDD